MVFGLSEKTYKRLDATTEGAMLGIFSAIPGLNVVVGAWNGYQSGRSAELINELKEKFQKLESSKLDIEFLSSEEFYDMLNKVCSIRLNHRSKLKAKFIVDLIGESATVDRDKHFSTEMKDRFLNIVDRLSDSDLMFLFEYVNGKYEGKSREEMYKLNESIAVSLDALYIEGILKDQDTWKKGVEFTRLGKEFLGYLRILAASNDWDLSVQISTGCDFIY